MYLLKNHTNIGGHDIQRVSNIEVLKNVNSINDNCSVQLPMIINNTLDRNFFNTINRGAYSVICLGYNPIIPVNFRGYISRDPQIHINGIATVELEDFAYWFRLTDVKEQKDDGSATEEVIEKEADTTAEEDSGSLTGSGLPPIPPKRSNTKERTTPMYEAGPIDTVLQDLINKVIAKHGDRFSRNLLEGQAKIEINSKGLEDIPLPAFSFPDGSCYRALEYLKTLIPINIYFRWKIVPGRIRGRDIRVSIPVLHAHPKISAQSEEDGGRIVSPALYDNTTPDTATFNLQQNVQNENVLQYHNRDDYPIEVNVSGHKPDGSFQIERAGNPDGVDVNIIKQGGTITQALAEQLYQQIAINGYQGTFDGYLRPYITKGMKVRIQDANFGHREGVYYCEGTHTRFSANDDRRTIFLGRRL